MTSQENQRSPACSSFHFVRVGALPLFGAMIGFGATGILATEDNFPRIFLLAMGAALFLAQLGIVWARAAHLVRRLKKHATGDEQKHHSILRQFPASVALQAAGFAALTGPLMLIGGSQFLSLDLGSLLAHTLPPLVIFQAACLFPLSVGLRSAVRATAMARGFPQKPLGPPGGLGRALTPIVVIPAILVTWALVFESNRFVESTAREWQRDSHYRASGVGMSRFETAGIRSAERLTSFSTISPSHHRINPASHPWTLKLSTFGPAPFFRFFFPVLLAAVFSALLLTIRSSRRLEAQFDTLEERIASLPEGKIKIKKDRPVFREMGTLTEAVDDLRTRINTMRQRKTAAIEKGREQREMKAEFFAGMSHDLRSPLNSIIGFADLLAKGLEGDLTDEQNRTVLLISEEAEKLMVLITDILDSSKLEAGKLELDRSPVAIVNVVTEAISESRRLIGTRPIDLLSCMHPGLPTLSVDKIRLRQALVSLIAKTMGAIDHGAVRVSTSLDTSANRLQIDIIDSSRTIPPTKMEQFHLSLNSLAQTTQGRGGKLGLGIGLARDVVRLHGGELLIGDPDSRHSIFTIILPLDDTPHRE